MFTNEITHKNNDRFLLDSHQSDILDKIFESTEMLVALMDHEFNFVKVNKAYAMVEGKSPDEFVGKNHFDLYFDEDNLQIFQKVVRTGEKFHIEAKSFEYPKNPERGVTYWNWSLHPIKNHDESVEGVILFLVNVTELKKKENIVLKKYNIEKTITSICKKLLYPKNKISELILDIKDTLKDLLKVDLSLYFEYSEVNSNLGILREVNSLDSQTELVSMDITSEMKETLLSKTYLILQRSSTEQNVIWKTFCHKDCDNILIFPITHSNQLYGTFQIYSYNVFKWDNNDFELISVFTSFISKALIKEELDRETQSHNNYLKKSLYEKEILLREIHHRVRNNLQLVSSMLELELANISEEVAKLPIQRSINRIRSIGLIYDQVYDSHEFSEINLVFQLDKLISRLLQSYGISRERINIGLDITQFPLSVDYAISLSLLANELLSSSFTHYSESNDEKIIHIEINQDSLHRIHFNYRDNSNVGDFSFLQNPKTLGNNIIVSILKQLNSKWTVKHHAGFEIEIYIENE